MGWEKQGQIYVPDGSQWWARSYTHIPTVVVLDEVIRVYFAGLDEHKYGRIGYVDLDKADPKQVVYIAPEPVLDIGELGCFDDCGVVPSSLINYKGEQYLYYIGFQRAERVPYMLFSGLAISHDGINFTKYAKTPILDRIASEPFSRSAPYILQEDKQLKMWYWSCLEWTGAKETVHYNNVIKYATSENGIDWQVYPHNCIEPDFIQEFSVGRPSVIYEDGLYRMWYSIRSFDKLYAIGYAESENGINWIRKDTEAGLEKSESGWDAEMVCYACVVNISGTKYMFYNGNRHGASGFGYAVEV